MMRIFIITAVGLAAACARGGSGADSAGGRDSVVVAGPPAVPTTQTPPAPATATARAVDSIRGVVSVNGTSFDRHVMIAERGTGRGVEVTGALASMIGRVAGTEIAAFGRWSGTTLAADRFVVRMADGLPALDGTLRTDDGVLYLVTADGVRAKIAVPPPPFAGRDGARVWITGDPAKGVSAFGFIDPPR